jgi:kynurenine formamidase
MTLLDLLARGLRAYDLAQPYRVGMPCSPTHPSFDMALRRRHGDDVRADGLTGSHEILVLGSHVGTHLDAPCHVAVDGRFFDGTPAADAVVEGRYRRHGVDEIPPLVRRGLLVDVPRRHGVQRLAPGQAVGVDDLEGIDPHPGDVVLVRTGWAQLYHDAAAYLGGPDGVPGVDESAAAWLAERHVAAVGADTVVLERVGPGGGPPPLPVHRILLGAHGIPLIEVMNLENVAAAGADEFLLVGAPLNIVGATGAPIRPLALVENHGDQTRHDDRDHNRR